MMRAGGDWGLENDGEPESDVVLARCMPAMGGEGAAMLGVAYGLGERAMLD